MYVLSAPMGAHTVYIIGLIALIVCTTGEQCTGKCRYSAHCKCSVLYTHQVCKCCDLCTAIKHPMCKGHCWGAWCTRRVHHACTKCASSAFMSGKLHQPEVFWHGNALLAQNVACVAHCCGEKLWIAARFRHSNAPSQPLTLSLAPYRRMHGR